MKLGGIQDPTKRAAVLDFLERLAPETDRRDQPVIGQ